MTRSTAVLMFLTAIKRKLKKTDKQTKFKKIKLIRVIYTLSRKYVTQEKHARYSNAQKNARNSRTLSVINNKKIK